MAIRFHGFSKGRPDKTRLWLAAGLTVLAFLLILPVIVADFLPFTDYPQHLSAISVVHHFGQAQFDFASNFVRESLWQPGFAFYALANFLASIFPIEAAARIGIALSIILFPLSFLLFLKAFDREPAYALFALPLTYNTLLFWGFIGFHLSLGLYFLGLAALGQLLKRWSVARGMLLVLVSILILFSHPYTLILFLGSAIWLIACLRTQLKALLQHAALLAPAGLLFLIWFAEKKYPPFLNTTELHPFLHRLVRLPDSLLHGLDSRIEYPLLAILLLCGLLLKFWPSKSNRNLKEGRLSKDTPPPAPKQMPGRFAFWALPGLALFNLIFYFILPISYRGWWFLYPRHLIFFALLAVASLPARPDGLPRRLSLGVLALCGLLMPILLATQFIAFDGEARGFDEVLAKMKSNKWVNTLILKRNSEVLRGYPYLHFGAYYQARKAGHISMSFLRFGTLPYRFRPDRPRPRTPANWEWIGERLFSYPRHGKNYHYFLIRSPGHRPSKLFGAHVDRVHLKAHSHSWWLYEKKGQPGQNYPGRQGGGG